MFALEKSLITYVVDNPKKMKLIPNLLQNIARKWSLVRIKLIVIRRVVKKNKKNEFKQSVSNFPIQRVGTADLQIIEIMWSSDCKLFARNMTSGFQIIIPNVDVEKKLLQTEINDQRIKELNIFSAHFNDMETH